jgi:hypothetical protein
MQKLVAGQEVLLRFTRDVSGRHMILALSYAFKMLIAIHSCSGNYNQFHSFNVKILRK